VSPRSVAAAQTTFHPARLADGGVAVRWLNELDWVEGEILANVWMTNCIARIDPQSGKVTGWAVFKASS
jgi:glutamine cyclotransferase